MRFNGVRKPGYTFTGEAFRKILTNPDLNKMADQVEPTIGPLINEKQLKQLMEDVRGSDDGNCFLSMGGGEDSQDLSFGVQSDMRGYGPQYHYISSSQAVHDLPTSSSPQPPAYPHNIPYSPGPVAGHRSSSTCISPISTTPYETCSNYSEASTSGPSTPPPGLTSSYMPIHARLPTIPSTTEYPGNWNFQISFGPLTESASKSATWTYSDVCKKLYVNLASFCPIKFKTNSPPPPGTYLRAVAVFKGSTNLHDIVKRCPNHMESSNDGSAPNNHFIRSNNPAARYHTCPESSRHSVLLPYNGPQVGTEYVTEMFAFMCFSSCASGPSRRPVEVIFTLEQNGQTLGRRVVEIRVCACPGRDRKSDEKVACGEPSSSQGVRRTRKGSGNKGPSSKRRRTSSRSQDEEFIITTKNRHVYDILLEMKDSLEGKFESLNIQSPEHSLVLSTSEDEADQPSTSGSPGAVFKRVGLSSM
ncbi:cellular tumor antigen p53-like isoform X2 [Orbicella faveolata]|uniref:cellular tumor antigen p53-like isoform X2 n=1 Tax=Orbicella faveolata TaxID=48498 RepID=UPI0009E59537|nr:cellular tumor antigen p53-like isoform X2 [Orbicella faveolata]